MVGNPSLPVLVGWILLGQPVQKSRRPPETARRLKRYEFMLTFAPISVEGGAGSPINPLAVF